MNNNHEILSAAVDNETNEPQTRQLVEALLNDHRLREEWLRHHIVSDALHNELPPLIDSAFASRISACVDQEPTVLAPRRASRLQRWAKHAAGFAVAASVSVVAILAIQPQDDAGHTLAKAPASQEYIRIAAQPDTLTNNNPPPLSESGQGVLDYYLVNHNEYSITAGVQGALPYARVVSHENAR